VFAAPAAAVNRVEIVNQPTCAICGKPLQKRFGAKTCSDACRKRYSRRKDQIQSVYQDAKSAIDALMKYASHDDLRDMLSVYVGSLLNRLETAKRQLDDLDRVPTSNRDTAGVTDSRSAHRAAALPLEEAESE
jgi:predicted nucleic acid-binding Zn ribbon protein